MSGSVQLWWLLPDTWQGQSHLTLQGECSCGRRGDFGNMSPTSKEGEFYWCAYNRKGRREEGYVSSLAEAAAEVEKGEVACDCLRWRIAPSHESPSRQPSAPNVETTKTASWHPLGDCVVLVSDELYRRQQGMVAPCQCLAVIQIRHGTRETWGRSEERAEIYRAQLEATQKGWQVGGEYASSLKAARSFRDQELRQWDTESFQRGLREEEFKRTHDGLTFQEWIDPDFGSGR